MDQNEVDALIDEADKGEDIKWEEVANTVCEHYWIESPKQDPKSNLLDVQCKNCWSGMSIDSQHQIVEDGKILRI